MLMQIASWKDPANWSRNLHRLIQRFGLSLNVVVNNVLCPCLFRNRITQVPWPVLFLSSWLPMVFAKTGGALLMNGFTVDQDDHEKALASFWQLYRAVDPNHAVYTMHPSRLGSVLPLMYHGDEGRGRLKRAVLVTSFVSALPVSGHPFLSHLLCTVFPGERYATGDDGVETLEALHAAVARDLNELLEHGWEVLASTCFIWLWSIYVSPCMLGCMRLKKKTVPRRQCLSGWSVFVETGHGNVFPLDAFTKKCCLPAFAMGASIEENATCCSQGSHRPGYATYAVVRQAEFMCTACCQ